MYVIARNLFTSIPIVKLDNETSYNEEDVNHKANKTYKFYKSEYAARIAYNQLLIEQLQKNSAALSILDKEHFE